MGVLRWFAASAANRVAVQVLAPRAAGDITLSVGSIVAIVLGVIVFTETIVLYCMMRKSQGPSSSNRRWY